MESEEENAPSVDGFLEEVTLNGSLKNEVEGSRGGLSGKGMVGRDGGGKGEVSNSMVCGSQWCVNSGAGSGELRVEPGEVEQEPSAALRPQLSEGPLLDHVHLAQPLWSHPPATLPNTAFSLLLPPQRALWKCPVPNLWML